jgi:hypothetical protein
MAAKSPGDRPGGLTALAVINFIFGVLEGLGLIVRLAHLDDIRRAFTFLNYPIALLYLQLLLNFLSAFLAIASGIGYVKQRGFLGRGLGNAYGVVGVLATVITAAFFSEFNIAYLILLLYPLMTLVLLNTAFRQDFARA